MRWYTHIVFALLIVILILPFVENAAVFTAVVLFASLLPDIDQKNARIHRYLPFTRWIQSIFDHRGIFHSLMVPVLLFSILYITGYVEIGMAVVLGYCSHLAIDSLTPHGVFYLYPLHGFHVKGFVKVGGLVEMGLFVGMVCSAAAFVWLQLV